MLECEIRLAGDKPLTKDAWDTIALGRRTGIELAKLVQALPANDDDQKFLRDEVTWLAAEMVRGELALLKKAGKDDDAKKLEQDCQEFLKFPKPRMNPDGKLFLQRSYRAPGPAQKMEACYVNERPDLARVELLSLVKAAHAQAMANIKQGKLDGNTLARFQEMVGFLHAGLTYEQDNPEMLPTFQACLALIEDVHDGAASAVGPNKAMYDRYMEVLKEREKKLKDPKYVRPFAPAEYDWINWNSLPPITAAQLTQRKVGETETRICELVIELYASLAARDSNSLGAVLTEGPRYATSGQVLEYYETCRKAGDFDRIISYTMSERTDFRIIEQKEMAKVLVNRLSARMVIKGQEQEKEAVGFFDVIQTANGPRLGYPKVNVTRHPPDPPSATRPAPAS